MMCPDCNVELEEVEVVEDSYDPGNPYGHKQYEYSVYQCPVCGYESED
jgi:rubredoxin